MGRLIDADLLKQNCKCTGQFEDNFKCVDLIELAKVIDAQPTAYDVEKVVAEIQKKHCKRCRNILGVAGAEKYCKEQKCEIGELCDIVKRGGVE